MANPSDEILAVLPLIQRFVGTSPEALDQIRAQVAAEIEHYDTASKLAHAQLAAIDQLIAGMKKAPQNGGGGGGGQVRRALNAPPLRIAIKVVLLDNYPNLLNRDEILDELNRRGWGPGGKNPRNTVTSRLAELLRAGDIMRSSDHFGVPTTTQLEGID